MSRQTPNATVAANRVPRASGDEPLISATTEPLHLCSPRERG